MHRDPGNAKLHFLLMVYHARKCLAAFIGYDAQIPLPRVKGGERGRDG